jgi:hypothetical protein
MQSGLRSGYRWKGAWIGGAAGEKAQWEAYMRNLRIVILALTAGAIFTLSASPAALAGGRERWQAAKADLISQFPSAKDKFKEDFGPDIDKLEKIYGQILEAYKNDSKKISSQWPQAIKLATSLKATIVSYKAIISPLTVAKVGDAKPGTGVAVSLKLDADVDAEKNAKTNALKTLQDIQDSVEKVVNQCKKVVTPSSQCG